MSGHWGQPGFWRREGWMLRRVLGLGRFRAPWRLTAREGTVHAVFFVLNYLVLAVVPFAVYYGVAMVDRRAALGAASVVLWVLIIRLVRGRSPRLRLWRR